MKVTLIAAVSADGFIAQVSQQSSLAWVSGEDRQFFTAKTKEIGTVIMGRATYETLEQPLTERRNIVMTSDPELQAVSSSVQFTAESPVDLIRRLGNEGTAHVAVIGGAQIYSAFLNEGLVNELYLTVEPVLFGSGIKLAETNSQIDLELLETERLGSQAVLLHYAVKSA